MSLSLYSTPNKDQQLESIQRELYARNREIEELQAKLDEEQRKVAAMTVATRDVRRILSPLYESLKLLFGDLDTFTAEVPAASKPKNSAVWDSWKQKLGGAAAKIIDLLMLHGELSQEQIRIHLGTKRMQTVYDAVSKLFRAGIINKSGGKISLKEL